MIRLHAGCYVFPQHVVAVRLNDDHVADHTTIEVECVDGYSYSVTQKECNQPINEITLLGLANAIAQQIGQAQLAPVPPPPYQPPPIHTPGPFAQPNKARPTETNRLLDDEIPF